MNTMYRNQLERKLDSVRLLENSGYGSTFERTLSVETLSTFEEVATAIVALLSVLAWCGLIVLVSL